MDVIGGNRLADYHGFIEGVMVIEYGDTTKTKMEVVGIGGLRKDDHIQLDSKKTPWMIAGDYYHAGFKE